MDAEIERVRENVVQQLQPMLTVMQRKGYNVRDLNQIEREAKRRVAEASHGNLVVTRTDLQTAPVYRLRLVLERIGGEP